MLIFLQVFISLDYAIMHFRLILCSFNCFFFGLFRCSLLHHLQLKVVLRYSLEIRVDFISFMLIIKHL